MNKKELDQNIIISLGMLIMFAYGILVEKILGSYGYISVLLTGIIVFIYLIIKFTDKKSSKDKNV